MVVAGLSAAALVGYPLFFARALPVVILFAVVAALSVPLALFVHRNLATVTLFSLGIEYLLVEATGRAPLGSIFVYPAGLFLLCETLHWAVELASVETIDRSVVAWRLGAVAVVAGVSVPLAAIATAARGLRPPGGAPGATIGVGAAVVLFAAVRLLSRTREARPGDGEDGGRKR
jgi:hypothetical protein